MTIPNKAPPGHPPDVAAVLLRARPAARGLLHPQRLELTALAEAEPPLLARQADTALRGLMSQSMVSDLNVPGDVGQPSVPSIQAHALLRDTVAARIPLDQRERILTAAARLPDHLLHDGESECTFLDSQTLRLFTPHALSLLQRAVDGRNPVLGPEHPETIMSTACLAEAIGEQQRWDEAEALARANLTTSEAAHGLSSPYTLAARHTLARALHQPGRLDEAEALATATLSERESSLGSAQLHGIPQPPTPSPSHPRRTAE